MMQDEFLAVLKVSHAKNPFAVHYGEIRQLESDSCPLCAVATEQLGHPFDNTDYDLAACQLDMNHALRDKIVHAADYNTLSNLSDIKMRQILLETLNLTEPDDDK